MNTEEPTQPIADGEPDPPQPSLETEAPPEPEPEPTPVTAAPPPIDPDDRLPYIALAAIVLFLVLCVALILIAYNNGPA